MTVYPAGNIGGSDSYSMSVKAGRPFTRAQLENLKLNIKITTMNGTRSEYLTFAGMAQPNKTQMTPREFAYVLRDGATKNNAEVTIQLPSRLPNGDVETVTIGPNATDKDLARIIGFNWAGAKNIFEEGTVAKAKPSAGGGSPAEISRGTGSSTANTEISSGSLVGASIWYDSSTGPITTRDLTMIDLGAYGAGAKITVENMVSSLQSIANRVQYPVNVRLPNGIVVNFKPNIAPDFNIKPTLQEWASTLASSQSSTGTVGGGSPTEILRGTGSGTSFATPGTRIVYDEDKVRDLSASFQKAFNKPIGQKLSDAADAIFDIFRRS